MKGKAIIPLALGLCIGLVAVKVGIDAIKKARGSVPVQQTVQVVRAKLDIDISEEITKEMVEMVETPDSALVPAKDRITMLDDVVGRVTGKSIPQYAPILTSMLAPPGTPPGMVGRIPQGYRAVSVKIDEVTGVAYQLKPGDWVDVTVVMDVMSTGRNNKKQTIAEVILQNVQVAAIGRDATAQPAVSGSPNVKPAKSATLLIPEEDVPKLHLAATRGKITLSMRGEDDKDTNTLTGVVKDTDAFLSLRDAVDENEPIDSTPSTPDAEIPFELPSPHKVVVYRGGSNPAVGPSVERITFESAHSTNIIGVAEGAADATTSTFNTGRGRTHGALPQRGRPESETEDRVQETEDE